MLCLADAATIAPASCLTMCETWPRRAETEEAGTGEESDAEKKKEKSTGWFDTAQQSAKASRCLMRRCRSTRARYRRNLVP